MQSSNSARFKVTGALSILAFTLSGCAALPSSGPTGRQVIRGAEDPNAVLKFAVIDLDGVAFQKLLATPPATRTAGQIAALAREGRVDRIAPGDALQINIYEVGMTDSEQVP